MGRTLSQLEIGKNAGHGTATHIYYTPSGEGYWNNIGGSLVIYGDPLLNYPPPTTHFINFGATKLKPKMDSKLKGSYYFLHNANTFDEVDLGTYGVYATYDTIKVGLRVTDYTNWVFQDIESGTKYRFLNTSSTGFDLVQGIHLNKGDGKLFRLIPTVEWEGEFLTDEVITAGEIISSEGTITVPEGVTLKIEGNYTLTDSLIIEDGGVLTLEPGSTLNLDSASSVYCAGDIYINGTETNKVTINFLQPNESKQNSIYLGRESSAIIKYAQIKNGYSGITATNGFDTLIIDNCNFTNISHAALLLNGAGYDKPLITNNTYTNCDYAGFFSNFATLVINSDSANTRSGYYFSNVSDLWFGNNNIPTAQLLAAQNTTNAITTTEQYHAQTEELTIALRGTTLNRNMKNDVGSKTTLNKSGMNNLMKRHGNKFTIKKEPNPVEIITEYSLSQNYPNPFNSSTIIEYALPKEGLVSIKLYDITGRLVKQLINEQQPMGTHKTTIESGNLASGIYIYSLRVNDININKKLVILK